VRTVGQRWLRCQGVASGLVVPHPRSLLILEAEVSRAAKTRLTQRRVRGGGPGSSTGRSVHAGVGASLSASHVSISLLQKAKAESILKPALATAVAKGVALLACRNWPGSARERARATGRRRGKRCSGQGDTGCAAASPQGIDRRAGRVDQHAVAACSSPKMAEARRSDAFRGALAT